MCFSCFAYLNTWECFDLNHISELWSASGLTSCRFLIGVLAGKNRVDAEQTFFSNLYLCRGSVTRMNSTIGSSFWAWRRQACWTSSRVFSKRKGTKRLEHIQKTVGWGDFGKVSFSTKLASGKVQPGKAKAKDFTGYNYSEYVEQGGANETLSIY